MKRILLVSLLTMIPSLSFAMDTDAKIDSGSYDADKCMTRDCDQQYAPGTRQNNREKNIQEIHADLNLDHGSDTPGTGAKPEGNAG